MYDSAIAHIVYASDDGFADVLGVSLVSLFENSGDMKEIRFYILDSGISKHNREKLEEVCTRYQCSLPVWLKARNITEELGMRVAADRGSLSQFARFFVASDLPGDLERVLYLECDIIFCQSVNLLWNLDMHGKTMAALNDAFSRYYRKNIDLEPEDIMFNSGVMLIDLKRWREQHIEKKLMKFIASKNGRVQQGDQEALNAVLSNDVYCFHPRFNSVTICYDFTYHELYVYRKPAGKYYTEAEIREATEHPVIIYFTTSFLSRRPWVKDCHHRYCQLWRSYKAESPWKDEPLREDTRPAWKLRGMRIFKKLPR
ncbi:glycosyltransferase family 8 protein [Bifidobacterium apri]|uniref:glycosyltransferase family 8 protein n=1 Tax=Bifidobacterium apri TaxID=1769423 RepID=UPI0039931B4F